MPSKEDINQRSNQATHGNSEEAEKIHRICSNENYYSRTPHNLAFIRTITRLLYKSMEILANRKSLLRK